MTTWSEFKKTKSYPALKGSVSADVVIVGGGMAGVLNAYILSKAGLKVVLLEKGVIGSGATLATTAFITKVIDTNLSEMVSIYGSKVAQDVWRSGQEAIEEFDKIIAEEKLECEFTRCPNYLFASTKKQFEDIKEDFKFYKRFKLGATLYEQGDALTFPNYGYLEVPEQAKFHPAKFLYALVEKAKRNGALIFEHTEVKDIEGQGPFNIKVSKGSISAKQVIIATYKPFSSKRTHLKKALYKSYVFEVEIPKGSFEEAIYEDNGNPYGYFRIDNTGEYDRMIIGGEDHKDIFGKTLDKTSFQALGKYLDKIMNGRRYWLKQKWSGPILEPSDGLALIGEIAPKQYMATAFSGNGMTYSMISALLLRDLILGKRSAWQKTYDPKRALFHPKRLGTKAKDYIAEFWNGALKNMLS